MFSAICEGFLTAAYTVVHGTCKCSEVCARSRGLVAWGIIGKRVFKAALRNVWNRMKKRVVGSVWRANETVEKYTS
jgi:hypothetical protein